MKAFHGDPAVKEKYLARLKAHHAADEIIQGTGWNGARGCAVGCTLNNYSHQAYETELGLPRWLAHLEDKIFEGLPPKAAQQFAVDLLESVPVGADVSKVRWQLASKRHTRDRDRIAQNEAPYVQEVVRALNLIIEYCDSEYKTESAESARSAAESAESAAESAWSAAESAWSAWSAWSAAESAAESAESAARSAESARSAAESSAESAARSAWSAWSAAESAWSAAESAESAAESAESAARSAESARSAEWSAWSAAAEWSAEWSAESARSARSAEWSARSAHFKWEAETLLGLLRAAPAEA